MKAVLTVTLALLAVACGAYSIPGSASSSTPTPRGGMNYDIMATNTDHGVTMRVGQTLEVVLRAPTGMQNWTHPKSSDQSVLTPIVDPAATAAVGVTLAAFEAMKPGQVDVSSTASPKCSPGAACPMYLAAYLLRVTVTLS